MWFRGKILIFSSKYSFLAQNHENALFDEIRGFCKNQQNPKNRENGKKGQKQPKMGVFDDFDDFDDFAILPKTPKIGPQTGFQEATGQNSSLF